MVSAALSGWFAIAVVLRYVKRHSYGAFALYRVVLGVSVLALVGVSGAAWLSASASDSGSRLGPWANRIANAEPPRWEGLSGEDLADRLGLPGVVVHGSVASTMDPAHLLAAEGAPAGTLVIADHQTAGRGRGGHTWISPPGSGIWMTLIERPTGQRSPGVVEHPLRHTRGASARSVH